MRISGTMCTRTAALTAMTVILVAGCGGGADDGGGGASGGKNSSGSAQRAGHSASPTADPTRIPEVGDALQSRIPAGSRQVVAVYGKGEDSADATVVLYTRAAGEGRTWEKQRSWPAHNGKRGWTVDHREGDKRSPVGVFTLTDAGGVLPDPGSRLPYAQGAAFAAPHYWPKTHWHDFDYVIAVDYNRVKGTSPIDPTRPEGRRKGGSIWLHMDHGSGTSGCVSLPKSGMEYLLRTLDPRQRPVVVMGDKAHLAS
ncbi:L,D-transpeptidase family protein [Streptomyces sp. XD-27]|uniref:L,D-transpeptidase family protein n=1 Tax=Streptomyces sp. XD-27 TaxID=3062779 RepID=UPI0026F421FC|nr:L,D-transpeptidase family protein [Streptomyces sp. XD-27]WKX74096.1 L,D-transpeptidase family protein [Streptomyces sp. XD-27]